LIDQKKEERNRRIGQGTSTQIFDVHRKFVSARARIAAEHGLTEEDIREVEHELALKARPWACGVGDCKRRYKEVNGLHIHYRNSGEHGKQGLELLRSGQHPQVNQMIEDGWEV
jgi:hypothetical protein